MLISPKLSLALPQLTAEAHLVWEAASRSCHYQARLSIHTHMHTEAHTHEHTQFTESRRPGRNIPKLAATWESWSTQVPQSATSSELFSHFPLLIQLLVTGSQCSTPHTFWVWHPRAVRKSYTSLSRCEEMMGREESRLISTSLLTSISLHPLFFVFFFIHPLHVGCISTQWQGALGWLTSGSSEGTCSAYWNLLIINNSQTNPSATFSLLFLQQHCR